MCSGCTKYVGTSTEMHCGTAMPGGHVASTSEVRRASRNLRRYVEACAAVQRIGTATKPPQKLSRPPAVSRRVLSVPA